MGLFGKSKAKIEDDERRNSLQELSRVLSRIENMKPRWKINSYTLEFTSSNKIQKDIELGKDYDEQFSSATIRVADVGAQPLVEIFRGYYPRYGATDACFERLKSYVRDRAEPVIRKNIEQEKKERESHIKSANRKFWGG